MALVPLTIPSYVLASIFRDAFAPSGVIGTFFLDRGEAFTGFWASVIVLTLACTPYAHLLVGAALARCPIREEEAARVMGANGITVFRYILVPRLKGPLMYAFLLVTLYVVSDFGAVAVLDCDVLTWELYKQRNGRSVFGVGLMLLLVVAPLIAGVRYLRSDESEEFAVGDAVVSRVELSPLSRGFAYALYGVFATVGCLMPIVFVTAWVLDGLANSVGFTSLWGAASMTAIYALVGGLVVCALSIVIGWALSGSTRHRKLLDIMVYVPSSLPGILIAVGCLQLTVGLARQASELKSLMDFLESSSVILLLAFTMRFLATGYAALRPAFNRLDPQKDLAARSLGASRWQRWRWIRLPSLAPSIAVAFALTFLSIAKELPITLTLAPLDQKTLAYHIFDAQAEGDLPDVGLASLCLVSIILVMQTTVQSWRRRYE